MPIGAAVGIAGVAGAGAQIYGANKAADAQTQAASMAQQTQREMYDRNVGYLSPFMQRGNQAGDQLAQLTGTNVGGNPLTAELTRRFEPTMAELENTPGYQFSRDQGLRAVQNSNAAKGLASSGNALKGAADYAEGLAGTTFQQQLQNYMAQNQQTFNMLNAQTGTGLQAASAVAGVGQGAANQISSAQIGVGNAQAGAAIGTGNAIAGGLNNATNGGLGYYMWNQMNNPQQQGGGGGNPLGLAGVSNPVSSNWAGNNAMDYFSYGLG